MGDRRNGSCRTLRNGIDRTHRRRNIYHAQGWHRLAPVLLPTTANQQPHGEDDRHDREQCRCQDGLPY
jgi:hypothetical protein